MINTIRNTIQNTIRNTLGGLSEKFITQLFVPVGSDSFITADNKIFKVRVDMSTPLYLFSGGQQGVWYDPSDLATMYQESTGVTAVTADGQPVGLMLDKSRGDVLGDELVTNGTFDTDTDWNKSDFWTISNGSATMPETADFNPIQQNVGFEVNKYYTVKFDVLQVTGSIKVMALRSVVNSPVNLYIFSTAGTKEITIKSTDSSLQDNIGFARSTPGIPASCTIDNISVKEVLGIHAQQPISTQRPTYNDDPDRLTLDLVDDALLFDVPTGGIDGYMVIGTNDGTASYGVSLPAGSYELGGDYFPSNTINGFLLREGAVSQADLSKVESDFVSKGAKASYGDVINFNDYWRNKNITEFPLIDTSSGTSFSYAWLGNKLTSFPLIDTSSGTNFAYAWNSNNLTSFPLINTSNGVSFFAAWYGNNLTSFPLIDTSSGTNFGSAWRDNNLTSFPLLNTSSGTNFAAAWYSNNLTSFPLIDTSSGTSFSYAWYGNNLTSFPLIDTSSGIDFSNAWRDNSLTSFPLIDTSSGTNFAFAWQNNSLTSFPLIDTSNGTTFYATWQNNSLTSFPLIDTSSGTNFGYAWFGNNTLADFPANMFDNCLCTNFTGAFLNTALTQASIDGILVSINSNGTSNGTFDQSGGSAPSSVGQSAIDAMRSRGWTITVTGGY